MITAKEALELVLAHAPARPPQLVGRAEASGLVLAGPLHADRDYPPFDRSIMDGYAVLMSHAGKTVSIAGESRPGVAPTMGPDEASCVEIMTGAPCPPGTEAVVMKEEAQRDGTRATLPTTVRVGQNIMPRGAECASGALILPTGAEVTPLALGLLAAAGSTSVLARPLPSLALLVTGDELVAEGEGPGDVEIRDSNGPMLEAMARAAGLRSVRRSRVRDTPRALALALGECEGADLVVLTGGVSAGNYDLVPAALEARGVTLVFHKVQQQPGKPILFGCRGSKLYFGLPGTPLGCHLGFHRYVLAAVRSLAGLPPPSEGRAILTTRWSTKSDRQQFPLARVDREGDVWRLTVLQPKGSSDLFAQWSANAYLQVAEGTRELPAGSPVTFERLGS